MTATAVRPTATPELALRSLLPYLVGLVLACLGMQLVIAATGDGITILAGVLTLMIGLGALAYVLVLGRGLGRLRFGLLTAHALLYVSVTGSFALHALLRSLFEGAVGPGWSGVLVAMPAVWSLGLLVHGAGAVLGRGFEAERA